MTPLILKRAPIDWNQEDYKVLEDGVVVGRFLFDAHWTEGPPLDVDDPRQQGGRTHRLTATSRRVRLRWRRSPRPGEGNRSAQKLAPELAPDASAQGRIRRHSGS